MLLGFDVLFGLQEPWLLPGFRYDFLFFDLDDLKLGKDSFFCVLAEHWRMSFD